MKPQNIILQYPSTASKSEDASLKDDREQERGERRYPELWLIDWGLAEFYHLQDYDYSLDLFSVGCLTGSLVEEAWEREA